MLFIVFQLLLFHSKHAVHIVFTSILSNTVCTQVYHDYQSDRRKLSQRRVCFTYVLNAASFSVVMGREVISFKLTFMQYFRYEIC